MAYTIGLMSGTSLDGVDAVLARFTESGRLAVEADAFVPYPPAIKEAVLALQPVGGNELDRAAQLGNALAQLYAEAVEAVLADKGTVARADVLAIGCHGQTIRHAPQHGYTIQAGNLARLAEFTGIDVAGDFRARDVAAGGQGAPLVPAFHQALFGHPKETRVILNIGGIANLTYLSPERAVTGFDCGPGNMLMDAWIQARLGQHYDAGGAWGAGGTVHGALLQAMLAEPYFGLAPPKSTGRDLFDFAWLERQLAAYTALPAQDVQATLLELTARAIADAINWHCPQTTAVYACGGGAHNRRLLERLAQLLPGCRIDTTEALGLPVHQVEAAAFAWLAWRMIKRKPGNLPEVTGAAGLRVLGALYPR